MTTAEESGAPANTISSSYGGGGAGGKFRKKPFRRQTTPYDRPATALRGNTTTTTNNDNKSSWLTKLVVEPASKLISYGADRFFGSVFRRRLPPLPLPLPPPQPPETEAGADVSDGAQGAGPNSQDGAQEPGDGHLSQPTKSSSSSGAAELEQLLRQKTFTRSEIVHLTELLKSRAVEVSPGDANHKNEDTASDFGRHQEFSSDLFEGNRNGEIRPSAVVSTPIHNSKVLEDDIASPAELAKAYMGSRPSKVSPSALGMRSQLGREDAGLLTNMPFASKSPIMSLTKKTSVSLGAPENGFITPRSRGRSAIYSMARTPYSRVQPTSILKGSGIKSNDYAGPSTSLSSSFALMGNDEKFESQPVTLKRRSLVLDDEIGSVSPIRRIRQKPNLLAPRFHHTSHGVGIGSHAKQKLPLIDVQKNKILKNTGENENESVPSTSYAHVPSKSSEVAARILQHLEKLTPKEKSPESRFAVREKSPLKSTPSISSGEALRSMENVGSSKLLLDVHDDHRFGDRTNATLPDVHDSSPRKQGKAEVHDPKASIVPSGSWNRVLSNDAAVSLKASMPSTGATDSVLKSGTSQPPQKKRAFRMSAEEDSLEQEDVQCNGLASRSLSEKKGPMESPSTDSKLASAEDPKLGKPTIQSEDKSPPSGPISRRSSEFSPGAVMVGERTNVFPAPASEEARATSKSEGFASAVAAFNKTKEANSPPPLFSFSSKVADKFPSLPSESLRRAEPELKSSSSMVNNDASTGFEAKMSEADKGFQLKLPKTGDINGKCDDVSPAASNGPLVSSGSAVTLPAASSGVTNQISTGSGLLFNSSTSIANFASTSTSATSSGSIFGLAPKPSSFAGPVLKFGTPADPSIAVSPASTSDIPEVADQSTKDEINPSSGSSSSSHSTVAAFAAANSGSSTFGLGSSVSFGTGNNLPGSLFATASKSLSSGAGTVLQGTSDQSVSSASVPAFNVNPSNNTFGFSSSASSSDTSSLVPVGGTTPSLFKFGASTGAASEGSAASSSTSATPGVFSFGLSSSSASTMTVGTSSGTTPSVFSLVGTSSASAAVVNTGSSFSSGTSGIFSFGGSSSATSSTINSVSSNSAPSTVFGSNWQSTKSPIFGSTITSSSPSSGFSFGAQSSASTTATAPMVFNGTSSSPIFSFSSASAPALSSPSLSNTQPVFGNPPITGGFGASPGNNDQMNAEDSMAEDPAPSSAPVPVFGQPSISPSPPAFSFGSNPSQTSPFMFGGQQNQVAPQNPSPFQASGSLEFSAGGSFSLGSGGGDKSGRRIVKINRNKNRKK